MKVKESIFCAQIIICTLEKRVDELKKILFLTFFIRHRLTFMEFESS